MKPIRTSLILLLAAGLFPQAAAAQDLPKDLRSQVGELLNETARKEVSIGKILIDSISMEKNEPIFFANMNCSYIPFRENNVRMPPQTDYRTGTSLYGKVTAFITNRS